MSRKLWQFALQRPMAAGFVVGLIILSGILIGPGIMRWRAAVSLPELKLLAIQQADYTNEREIVLLLKFNDVVVPSELERHLKLIEIEGEEIPYTVETQEPAKTIAIRTESTECETPILTLSKGLIGREQNSLLRHEIRYKLNLAMELRIGSAEAVCEDFGHLCIRFFCTRSIDPKSIEDFIRIEPETSFTVSTEAYGFRITGAFQYGKKYRVRVLPGLKAISGKQLQKEVTRTIFMPDRPPLLRFKTRGFYLAKEGNRILPLECVNVKDVELTVCQVYENNVIHFMNASARRQFTSDTSSRLELSRTLFTKKLNCAGQNNEIKIVNLDLRGLLGPNAYGIYFFTVHALKEDARDSQLVIITDIGLTAKKSDTEMLIWVTALSTAEPLPSTTVAVYSRSNQKLLEGITDAHGLLHFKNVKWDKQREPFAVVATRSGDMSVLRLEEGELTTSSFDTGGRPYLRKGYESFVYTDRGIYRPGEKVHLRSIVRAPGPALPERFPVNFKLLRPDNKEFKTYTSVLSEWGTAEIECELPPYAMTGGYNAMLTLPDGTPLGATSFKVEEFMPDRMKVTLSAEDRRYQSSEKIPLKVKATHLFGSPAADRKVEVRCRLIPTDFEHPEFPDYRFCDSARSLDLQEQFVLRATLDANGEAFCNVELPTDLRPPSAATAILTATVKEVGGRAITASLSRQVDAYPRYVGLKRVHAVHVQPGQMENISCVLISPAGKPVKEAEVKVTFYRVIWNTVLKLDGGHYRYQSEREEKKVSQSSCTIIDGRAVLTFTPKSVGEYLVRVSDEKGGASADLTFYCAGEGDAPWAMEKPDRIELKPERSTYLPGETARILVHAPFPGMALLTIESDRVHLARTFLMEKNTQQITIPIEASFAPNVYCAVTVIRKLLPSDRWTTHRAFGVVPIRLNYEDRRLEVAVKCADEVRPGIPLRVRIEVAASDTLGCRAEIALAAVDVGICHLTEYLTPDPWAFFYTQRALAMCTSDFYSLLIPEVEKKKVGSDLAVSGDLVEIAPPLPFTNPIPVDRVKLVALWQSKLETSEEGIAETKIEVPAWFNGRLRLMAVASTEDEFGSAEKEVVVRQPLMVQTSLPRFLAPEDEFDIPVTIFNYTKEKGPVSLNVQGVEGLEILSQQKYMLEVPQDGERTALFRARAPKLPGRVKCIVTASLGHEKTADETELSVRPPTTIQFDSGNGRLTPDQTGTTTYKFKIPGDWISGTDRYWLCFSAHPAVRLGAALQYVVQYPYGCVEQTTSSVFPLLYLSDIASLAAPETFNQEDVADFVQAGIARIFSMQTSRGGFAMWPGSISVWPWGSVYATHFLLEASKAGYPVNEEQLGAALDYLEQLLSSWSRRLFRDETFAVETGLPLQTYACYVLARAGRPVASWAFRLYEERERLPLYSRAHLACALALLKEPVLAKALLSAELPALPKDKQFGVETGGLLHSHTRECAILLATYLEIDPDSPRVPSLLMELERAMQNGRWSTTQENSFALLALGKYARYLAPQKAEYQAEVLVQGKTLAKFTHKDMVSIQPEKIGGQEIEVRMSGTGALFYYWAAQGVPRCGEPPAKDEGIQIRRRFLTRDGTPIHLQKVPHGDILIVELAVKAEHALHNVVISDLLPAGFEIENPCLDSSEKLHLKIENLLHAERVERRDDRLLIFTDLPKGIECIYRYVVRAVTAGRFRLPSVNAFCMYQPSISSLHGGGLVQVIK